MLVLPVGASAEMADATAVWPRQDAAGVMSRLGSRAPGLLRDTGPSDKHGSETF